MKVAGIEVVLRPGFGAVRAYADVTINFDDGQLTVFGFPVIQKDGRSPWVGFPQKPGSKAGKYFPLMEAKGEIRRQLTEQILRAYQGPMVSPSFPGPLGAQGAGNVLTTLTSRDGVPHGGPGSPQNAGAGFKEWQVPG